MISYIFVLVSGIKWIEFDVNCPSDETALSIAKEWLYIELDYEYIEVYVRAETGVRLLKTIHMGELSKPKESAIMNKYIIVLISPNEGELRQHTNHFQSDETALTLAKEWLDGTAPGAVMLVYRHGENDSRYKLLGTFAGQTE